MKVHDIKAKWKQYQYVALVLGLGVILLVWPQEVQETQEVDVEPTSTTQTWDLSGIQQEMEGVLACIDGVGQVRLMLTLESQGVATLAQDSAVSYSGSAQSPEDYTRSSEVIVVTQDGTELGLVTQQTYPQFRGALVVCEGGEDPVVRLAVTQGVAALTGLGTDRITVATWESSFGGGTTA